MIVLDGVAEEVGREERQQSPIALDHSGREIRVDAQPANSRVRGCGIQWFAGNGGKVDKLVREQVGLAAGQRGL